MIPPPVPPWKKWLMLAFVLSFVVLASILFFLRRSARGWDPNQPGPLPSRREAP